MNTTTVKPTNTSRLAPKRVYWIDAYIMKFKDNTSFPLQTNLFFPLAPSTGVGKNVIEVHETSIVVGPNQLNIGDFIYFHLRLEDQHWYIS